MLNLSDLDVHGYSRAGRVACTWPSRGPDGPVRDVLADDGWARDLARSPELADIASSALGATAWAVRANLFVKSTGSNWSVPWHQDRVVCVRERADVEGFTAWSTKAGLPHANAPARVLREMVAIRLHLDPCGAESGPLEVVAGTHERVLSTGEITRNAGEPRSIVATAGEAVVMRPLLLHRSRSMRAAASRRVLHVEFAAAPLPRPLKWHYE